MLHRIHATEVFTPSDFPTHTYVTRDEPNLESRLSEAMSTPGEIISVSGPSKSGKTVLIERVVGADNLITVTGAAIRSGDELWDKVLDWMGTADTESKGSSTSIDGTATTSASGGVNVPFVAKGEVSGSVGVGGSKASSTTESRGRQGMPQVIREIANSDFVLFIDDFHYMDRDVQEDVARQIKEAAAKGVKICAASVPHRSDDVVRSNPELRGRVRAVDLDYWNPQDLAQIGILGFHEMKIGIDPGVTSRFAAEASGSPQLMQAMCLQLCFLKEAKEQSRRTNEVAVSTDEVSKVLEETTTRADFSSLVRNLYTGPKRRGQERKEHSFIDGSVGDVYRAVLLALAFDPPLLSFNYEQILSRVDRRV
jgi:hypothetical protein